MAFIVDMATVVPYAQYVAEGFVLLITAVHGFRCVQLYMCRDEHTLSRSRSVFRDCSRSRGIYIYLLFVLHYFYDNNHIILILARVKSTHKIFDYLYLLMDY